MDPQVGTSFIPKRPLGETARGSASGFLFLVSLLIFIASIVAGGGAFGYGVLLNQQVASKSASLANAQGAFDPPAIQDLLRVDARIQNARRVMDKHTAPSALFAFLSQNTLATVQFTAMNYAISADGSASLTLDGQAKTFSDVALQSDAFGGGKILKDVIFSSINVAQNGVTFTVKATVSPSFLLYKSTLANQTTPTTQ